ncbi:AMP-binding protein [Actinomadura chibensis]|uniref:AMP-binding protein n=1 Tax=Actinomadura chibensis TaxID=392828 RepID=UPI001FE6B313|nr:AMP-binding protein [Actinomadura chibensis]
MSLGDEIASHLNGQPHPLADRYLRAGWWTSSTVLDDFLANAAQRPDKIAVTQWGSGAAPSVRLSFGDIADLSARLAGGLASRGVRSGDVVSFQLPNWWQFPVVAVACARMGAIANPILPFFRTRELAMVLSSLRSTVYIAPSRWRGHDFEESLEAIRPDLPYLRGAYYVDSEAPATSFSSLLTQPPASPTGPVQGGDVAEIQFTSGTTGQPKGVVHTYNGIRTGYRAVSSTLGLTGDDVVLTMTPMAHQVGFLNGCWMPLAEGMSVVYQDTWDPGVFLDIVTSEHVTYTAGATAMMVDACAAAEARALRPSTLRYFKNGGSAVPASVAERVTRLLGADVVVSWGMTENGVCTITPPGARGAELTDGRPVAWAEVKVVDDDGSPVRQGRSGHLLVRSASQCVGYFPGVELYPSLIDRDGWFATGDIARMNRDGSIKLLGRRKDLIIRGGENIPVLEVESALRSIPGVSDVVVVGVPDDRLGERACAVIVPAPGHPPTSLDVARDHLRALGMAKPYWPESLVLWDGAFPTTASGKVAKAEVRARIRGDIGERADER